MHERRIWIVGTLSCVFVGLATALVTADAIQGPADTGRSADFQRLVGGLGLGPAINLSTCQPAFDLRIGEECPSGIEYLPGNGGFCPHHVCSVISWPGVVEVDPSTHRKSAHAVSP